MSGPKPHPIVQLTKDLEELRDEVTYLKTQREVSLKEAHEACADAAEKADTAVRKQFSRDLAIVAEKLADPKLVFYGADEFWQFRVRGGRVQFCQDGERREDISLEAWLRRTEGSLDLRGRYKSVTDARERAAIDVVLDAAVLTASDEVLLSEIDKRGKAVAELQAKLDDIKQGITEAVNGMCLMADDTVWSTPSETMLDAISRVLGVDLSHLAGGLHIPEPQKISRAEFLADPEAAMSKAFASGRLSIEQPGDTPSIQIEAPLQLSYDHAEATKDHVDEVRKWPVWSAPCDEDEGTPE